jgi:hypothetical protein
VSHKRNDPYPRLCYLGGVKAEATSAGMMLLYKLLESYPPDRLKVIHVDEGDDVPERPDRRIRDVEYFQLRPVVRRGLFFSRMHLPRFFWTMLEAQTSWQAREAARLMAAFRPEAILTVHELFGWMTASRLAERLKVPLHLVLHDEWFRNVPMAASLPVRFEASFGRVYRSAASRLCVSPYMEQEYARRFGAAGTVLYPMRARTGPSYEAPPSKLGQAGGPLKVAYGGNVYHKGYWEALCHLASALESIGGQLLIFGPDKSEVKANGLDRPNVVAHGFVYNMLERVREEANVLFVPMTFEASEKSNMQFSFPSKLAEYTAAGLPLLIYGPEYGSVVRWARENPESAEVVTCQGEDGLRAALERLLDPMRRENLARRALELGDQYFSYESGASLFQEAVQSGYGPHIRPAPEEVLR